MRDFEGFNDMSILGMMPVTKEQSTGEDLVWVVLGNLTIQMNRLVKNLFVLTA